MCVAKRDPLLGNTTTSIPLLSRDLGHVSQRVRWHFLQKASLTSLHLQYTSSLATLNISTRPVITKEPISQLIGTKIAATQPIMPKLPTAEQMANMQVYPDDSLALNIIACCLICGIASIIFILLRFWSRKLVHRRIKLHMSDWVLLLAWVGIFLHAHTALCN